MPRRVRCKDSRPCGGALFFRGPLKKREVFFMFAKLVSSFRRDVYKIFMSLSAAKKIAYLPSLRRSPS